MHYKLFDRAFPKRIASCAALLLPLLAVSPAHPQTATAAPADKPIQTQPASAQPASVAFWDIPDRLMAAMLASPPAKEEDRRARLRQYFVSAGCTGDHLSDLFLDPDKHHSILQCTLPGDTASRIVVTTGLPRNEMFNGATDGWPNVAMLAMLYHALKAQPRHATFVFAAIAGKHGDLDLQKHLVADGAPAPLAMVSLDDLGLGTPAFANLAPNDLAASVRANAEALQTEAWRMMYLMHIDATKRSVDSQSSPSTTLIAGLVRDGPKDLPRILVFSNPVVLPGHQPAVTVPAFHQDYDYLGFFLADIDEKLAPASPPAPPATTPR
ncbi:MAG: hypothetical protein WCC27_00375 [Acidobacteriaceae bacterium]